MATDVPVTPMSTTTAGSQCFLTLSQQTAIGAARAFRTVFARTLASGDGAR